MGDAKSPPTERVVFGYAARGGGSAPYWMAQEAGIFAANGLATELRLIPGALNALSALQKGEVQFVNVFIPCAYRAVLGGADLLVITGSLNQIIHMFVAPSSVRSPVDLKGKRVGVAGPGDTTTHMVRFYLQRWGLDPEQDVELVPIGGSGDERFIDSLLNGAIQGTAMVPPASLRALQEGCVLLEDTRRMAYEYQVGGIVTTRKLATTRPDLVGRFVRSCVEGTHRFKSEPALAARVMQSYSREDDDTTVVDSCNYWAHFLQEAPLISDLAMSRAIDSVARHGEDRARLERASDNKWVRELVQEGFIEHLYGGQNKAKS